VAKGIEPTGAGEKVHYNTATTQAKKDVRFEENK
jgi:hypothetical protein